MPNLNLNLLVISFKPLRLWQWTVLFEEVLMKANMRFLKCARISYVQIQVVHFNYSWREKRIFKTIVLSIKIRNTIYMSCNITLSRSWYYEVLEIYCFFYYLKKRQSSCSIIVVVVIQNLVLDIFFSGTTSYGACYGKYCIILNQFEPFMKRVIKCLVTQNVSVIWMWSYKRFINYY